MKKIGQFFNALFPQDKAIHFIVGLLAFALGAFWSPWLGSGLCVGAAFLKEYCDKYLETGHFEVADFIYTVAGGAVGLYLTLCT